jgi:hypothetical protein
VQRAPEAREGVGAVASGEAVGAVPVQAAPLLKLFGRLDAGSSQHLISDAKRDRVDEVPIP